MDSLSFDDWPMNLESAPAGCGPRLLLIEDDPSISREVAYALTARSFAVQMAATGIEGLELAIGGSFDAIITDRILPGLDGLEIIAHLRDAGIHTPVLVLSSLDAVTERIRGLKAGGDDYLAKPFAIDELVTRTEVMLRRLSTGRETLLRVGPFVVDLLERTVHRGKRAIDLLPREFKLLEYMARRPNQVLTRPMLLRDVWHYTFAPETNLVDVHIGKLRRKLTVAGETEMIVSVRGVGFMLATGQATQQAVRAASCFTSSS
jgi:two-component system, OmpR family, response regulator